MDHKQLREAEQHLRQLVQQAEQIDNTEVNGFQTRDKLNKNVKTYISSITQQPQEKAQLQKYADDLCRF